MASSNTMPITAAMPLSHARSRFATSNCSTAIPRAYANSSIRAVMMWV